MALAGNEKNKNPATIENNGFARLIIHGTPEMIRTSDARFRKPHTNVYFPTITDNGATVGATHYSDPESFLATSMISECARFVYMLAVRDISECPISF